LGNLLRDLAGKAAVKINNNKRLTFHCFRKMFPSAAIDSGIGLIVGKILCGKTNSEEHHQYDYRGWKSGTLNRRYKGSGRRREKKKIIGYQPWRFVVVQNPESSKNFFKP
jgi:hypothetical protein